MNKFIKIFMVVLFISFVINSCAGTSEEDEYSGLTEEERKQQQELDEIESLLGIKTDDASNKPDTKKQPESKDNRLGLLDSEDLSAAAAQPADVKKLKKLEKENSNLKSELNQKNLVISDLKAQIQLQRNKISELEGSQSSKRLEFGSFNVAVGDVSPEEYEQRYQEGYNLFNAREYSAAQQVFESLLASSVNHNLADNAQYWIGESHYALRKYDKAIMDFEKVFTFPNSNKSDDAQFKLGLCYLKKGDKQKAKEEFQRLLDVYPNSEYAGRVEKHLQQL